MNRPMRKYDVAIVGGGPSGLSAALVLGRACRRVLVCDSGSPRNAPSAAVHSLFSRDGIKPAELLRIGREQLKPYGVEFHEGRVTAARKIAGGFEVIVDGKEEVTARKLILATGMVDELPEITGLKELWGSGVLGCPYCHGWEVRDRPLALLGQGEAAIEFVTVLLGWSKDLALCTNGPARLSHDQRRWLKERRVQVHEEKIERLDGEGGKLRAIMFENGTQLKREALFVRPGLRQRSDLPKKLGCTLVAKEGLFKGMVEVDQFGFTGVDGLYVIGDASRGIPQVVTAVSDGALAAIAANTALLTEDAQ